jgi:hypothetical protein
LCSNNGIEFCLSIDAGAASLRLSARGRAEIMACRRSQRSTGVAILAAAIVMCASAVETGQAVARVSTDPAEVRLVGPSARRLVLVTGTTSEGATVDLTRSARFRVLDPAVATVDALGMVRAVGDGRTAVEVEAGGELRTVGVQVEGSAQVRPFNFENDIVPVLSKLGCNASGCHGKAEGQNGFKLSVFGFDPAADHVALTKESRGRRVFPAAPEQSLVLLKMSGALPHGGGVRATPGSEDYQMIRDWIAAGTPFGNPSDPRVVAIRVEPRERRMAMKESQQLRVTAVYSDGREADVTGHAKFQSNNDALAGVDADGLVTAGEAPGDVAIMAAYMGAVDVFRALVPRPGGRVEAGQSIAAAPSSSSSPIDALVLDKLRKLNIEPSGPCTDAAYLRRVYLDVIGMLPTPEEARRFLADGRADRRARLVDELLGRPEYADYWALKWSDLLRVDREKLGHKRAFGYYRWLRGQVAANAPLDRFARAVVTAEGPLDEVGPASFFKVVSQPGEAAGSLAQVFLGVRIACAECHHHPYDRWGQDDYYGMQAFFTPLAVKPGPRGDAVLAVGEAVAKNPRSGLPVRPRPLGEGGEAVPGPAGSDPRTALADWLASAANPYFARNLANRYWAHFLGRGLVEPVDDFRDTNPPSNPELLDALARILVESGFDAQALIRAITASATYQRSTEPNATNSGDEQNDSRARLRRLDAEVLLDMVCQVTGVPEKFAGVPAGVRAVQLWDSKVAHDFLRLFGRPVRITACECERNAEPGVGQVLHLLNAPSLQAKLSHEAGALARMAGRLPDDSALAEEIYLAFYSRMPSVDERAVAVRHLARDRARRREAAEDLAWSLMNSLEFLFNH